MPVVPVGRSPGGRVTDLSLSESAVACPITASRENEKRAESHETRPFAFDQLTWDRPIQEYFVLGPPGLIVLS